MTWVLDHYHPAVGRSYFELYYFVESDYNWENITEEEKNKWFLKENDKFYNKSYGYIFKLKFKATEKTIEGTIEETIEDGFLMPGRETKAEIIEENWENDWKKAKIKNIPLNNCYWYDFKSKDDFINFIEKNKVFSEVAEKKDSISYKNNSKFLNIKIKYDNENKLIDYINFNTTYSFTNDIKEISIFYEKGFSLQKNGKFINLNSFLKNSEENTLQQYNVEIDELKNYKKLEKYKLRDKLFLYQNEAFTNIDENNNKDKLQTISQSGFDDFYKNVTDWLVLENYYKIPYADAERETGCAYKTLLEGKIGSNFGVIGSDYGVIIWWDGLLQTISVNKDIIKIFGPISYWMIQARGGDPFVWTGDQYDSNPNPWLVSPGEKIGSWHGGGSGAADLLLINFEKGNFNEIYIWDASETQARGISIEIKNNKNSKEYTPIACVGRGSDGNASFDNKGNIIIDTTANSYGKKGEFLLIQKVDGIQHFPCNGLNGYYITGNVYNDSAIWHFDGDNEVNWKNYFNGKTEIKTTTLNDKLIWGKNQKNKKEFFKDTSNEKLPVYYYLVRSIPSLNSGLTNPDFKINDTWAKGRGAGGGGRCIVGKSNQISWPRIKYEKNQTYNNSEAIREAVWLLDAKR